jgi:hypothetical protein
MAHRSPQRRDPEALDLFARPKNCSQFPLLSLTMKNSTPFLLLLVSSTWNLTPVRLSLPASASTSSTVKASLTNP